MVHFATSGVETWWWLPPLVSLVISFFTTMVGVSGAFLLLPFQISVLGFAGPAASATNLVFNLWSTPAGIWGYRRQGRLHGRLTCLILLGSLPGVWLGVYLRNVYLPDPQRFRLLVAAVLSYLAYRLGRDLFCPPRDREVITNLPVAGILVLSLVVGVIGSAYGMGGGAIIAPFCLTVFRLPMTMVAPAALTGTLVSSLVGLLVYTWLPLPTGGYATPDWLLGSLFGLGGVVGASLGAACQSRFPIQILKTGLALVLAGLAGHYAGW